MLPTNVHRKVNLLNIETILGHLEIMQLVGFRLFFHQKFHPIGCQLSPSPCPWVRFTPSIWGLIPLLCKTLFSKQFKLASSKEIRKAVMGWKFAMFEKRAVGNIHQLTNAKETKGLPLYFWLDLGLGDGLWGAWSSDQIT